MKTDSFRKITAAFSCDEGATRRRRMRSFYPANTTSPAVPPQPSVQARLKKRATHEAFIDFVGVLNALNVALVGLKSIICFILLKFI
jgi:hypothetical protein